MSSSVAEAFIGRDCGSSVAVEMISEQISQTSRAIIGDSIDPNEALMYMLSDTRVGHKAAGYEPLMSVLEDEGPLRNVFFQKTLSGGRLRDFLSQNTQSETTGDAENLAVEVRLR